VNVRPGEFRFGILLVLGAVLIWGIQLPVAKNAMLVLDGYSLSVVRYGVAVLMFTLLLAAREGWVALRFDGRGGPAMVAGGFGIAGSALLVFVGLAMTRPEVAVIILMLQPALTALAQWLLRGVRPHRFTVMCLGVAFAGVVVAVTRGGDALNVTAGMGSRELLGNGLVFLGAVAWITYTMMLGLFPGWSALRFTTLTAIPGLGMILIVWVAAWTFGAASWPTVSVWISVAPEMLFVSLLGVVAAMFLWNAGNRRIGPVNTMLLLNLMPVITFAIRHWQGARFAASELVGAGMVVGALVANNLHERRRMQRDADRA